MERHLVNTCRAFLAKTLLWKVHHPSIYFTSNFWLLKETWWVIQWHAFPYRMTTFQIHTKSHGMAWHFLPFYALSTITNGHPLANLSSFHLHQRHHTVDQKLETMLKCAKKQSEANTALYPAWVIRRANAHVSGKLFNQTRASRIFRCCQCSSYAAGNTWRVNALTKWHIEYRPLPLDNELQQIMKHVNCLLTHPPWEFWGSSWREKTVWKNSCGFPSKQLSRHHVQALVRSALPVSGETKDIEVDEHHVSYANDI